VFEIKKYIEKNIWCIKRKWSVGEIRTNQELVNLYRETDVTEIMKRRLRWLLHVEKMSEEKQ
jgi:hypothetical protein